MNTFNTITIGRTDYTVEQASTDPDVYFLTGPRGGVLTAVPYSNNPDLYHAFRTGGSYADLKVNGQTARINKADLAAAVTA